MLVFVRSVVRIARCRLLEGGPLFVIDSRWLAWCIDVGILIDLNCEIIQD